MLAAQCWKWLGTAGRLSSVWAMYTQLNSSVWSFFKWFADRLVFFCRHRWEQRNTTRFEEQKLQLASGTLELPEFRPHRSAWFGLFLVFISLSTSEPLQQLYNVPFISMDVFNMAPDCILHCPRSTRVAIDSICADILKALPCLSSTVAFTVTVLLTWSPRYFTLVFLFNGLSWTFKLEPRLFLA